MSNKNGSLYYEVSSQIMHIALSLSHTESRLSLVR